MNPKKVSIQFLEAIHKLNSMTHESILDSGYFNQISKYLHPVESFFQINSLECIVLSIFLEVVFREINLPNDRIMKYFGDQLGLSPDIYQTIGASRKRKLLIDRP